MFLTMNLFPSLYEAIAVQDHMDRERWQYECRVIDTTLTIEQLNAYEASVQQYAATTIHSNHEVVAVARRLALDALKRGESLPVIAEQAIEDERLRQLARLLG